MKRLIELTTIQTILVYSEGELIGDGMIKLPFLKALRHLFPISYITWMTGQRPTVFKKALFDMTKPYIDEILEATTIGCSWSQLIQKPFNKSFDLILNTSDKIKPCLILKRIPHRCFISSAWNWNFSDIKPATFSSTRLIEKLLDLLRVLTNETINIDLDIYIPKQYQERAKKLLPYNHYIALAPGAGGRYKCWPLKNFIVLAKDLIQEGLTPVFILGPAEEEWKELIEYSFPNVECPLQKGDPLSVYLTIALGQRCQVCVVHDAGVGHILAASSKPLVTLFGPTPAEKFTPNGKNVTILSAKQYGGEAMHNIPVKDVLQALNRYL